MQSKAEQNSIFQLHLGDELWFILWAIKTMKLVERWPKLSTEFVSLLRKSSCFAYPKSI